MFVKLMVAGDGVEKTERISSMDCAVATVLSMELLGKECCGVWKQSLFEKCLYN
jgi:hypothetical protein